MKNFKLVLSAVVLSVVLFCSCENEQSDIELETSANQESIVGAKRNTCAVAPLINNVRYVLEVTNRGGVTRKHTFSRKELDNFGGTSIGIEASLGDLFPKGFLKRDGVKSFKLTSSRIDRAIEYNSQPGYRVKKNGGSNEVFDIALERQKAGRRINHVTQVPKRLAKRDLGVFFQLYFSGCLDGF